MSVPSGKIGGDDKAGVVGNLLVGDFFSVVSSIVGVTPSRKIDVYFEHEDCVVKVIENGTVDAPVSKEMIQSAVRRWLSNDVYCKWKKSHEKRMKAFKKVKPSVVYSNRSTIRKCHDGTFEIPYEAPATQATNVFYETVYAEGYGVLESGETFTMQVPIEEREKVSVKKLTNMYDYNSLKAIREEYETRLRELANEQPPVVDEEDIKRVVSSGKLSVRIGGR